MNDEALLDEIKTTFDSDVLEWADIRTEGNEDMRYIADGPWTAQERKDRKAADRPCLVFDELSQYTSQAIGDMRQNKRAIKVTPKGNGATDATAQKRAGMIRQIEYESVAQIAYATGFESMIKRGYGYWKLTTQYSGQGDSFDQELLIQAIANPDTCYLDPFAKKSDWSDMGHGFLLDFFSEKAFKNRWPDAEIQSFEGEHILTAPAWIKDKRIQVAEYWRLEKKSRELLLLDTGDKANPQKIFLDELPEGAKVKDSKVRITLNGATHDVPLLNHRKTETPTVMQYITNGLEILERNKTKWKEVPIIPVFGPEEYVDDGGGSKKRLLSMVRKARDSYKAYCYAKTNEVEVMGMVPKVLYMGYEGQFDTKTPWADVNKQALAYGEVKALTAATGKEVLPLPQRQLYDPPLQAMEMAASSFRLAVQSAMGVGNGMVNGKGGQNFDAKSGKAIDALDRQEAQGVYQFIGNFERGLERTGRMADDALDWVYDTAREVGTRAPDDTYSAEKINQPVQNPQTGETTQFNTADGDHGTTISVGPSEQSTRDAADDFVESLIGMKGCPPKILALAVKLKNLGPIGDEIAEAFDPGDQEIPAAAQQQMAGMKQELDKAHALAQSLFEKIQTKQPELQVRIQIATMQEETKRVLGLATINAEQAQQKLDKELGIVNDKLDRIHAGNMLMQEHANAKDLQQGQQAGDAQAQAADHGAAASAQASDQAADAASQDSAQGHQATQATQAQGAAADAQQSAQDAAAQQADEAA
jgi:hypothetical protein